MNRIVNPDRRDKRFFISEPERWWIRIDIWTRAISSGITYHRTCRNCTLASVLYVQEPGYEVTDICLDMAYWVTQEWIDRYNLKNFFNQSGRHG